jgi:triosephosphate isomerase
MNGSLAFNAALLSELKTGVQSLAGLTCDIAVCVPAPYLAQVQPALQDCAIKWGAQDVSSQAGGAYTGEVAASMLKDFSCHFAIVGHSERRIYHAENDELVAKKTLQLLKAGITPIVCVGETLQERKADQTEAIVGRQLNAVLHAIDQTDLGRIVVAYEPVWAIGTGMTATPEMAQRVHAFLRSQLAVIDKEVAQRVQILYGGSMKPDNAAALLAMQDIDGGLIGGAALKSADFLGIISETI